MDYIQCKTRWRPFEGEISRKCAQVSSILRLLLLPRGTTTMEVVVGTATTAKLPKTEGTPVSGSVGAL